LPGAGADIAISDLARLIAKVIGFDGRFVFDVSKPDGTPRKLLDVSRIKSLGWEPRISLREGLTETYRWYREQENDARDPAEAPSPDELRAYR
jgi:GDP-L-fucose synthase